MKPDAISISKKIYYLAPSKKPHVLGKIFSKKNPLKSF
jgi:hypothetical protein